MLETSFWHLINLYGFDVITIMEFSEFWHYISIKYHKNNHQNIYLEVEKFMHEDFNLVKLNKLTEIK